MTSDPNESISLVLGTVEGDGGSTPLLLHEVEHLAEHVAIHGGTGQGKSKLFYIMLVQLIVYGRGFCLIDPHGDLAEDVVATAYLLHRQGLIPLSRFRHFHYLYPASKTSFSFDPFQYDGPAEDHYSWLHARSESVAHAIIRMQGEADFNGKPRLARWLKNALFACGVPLDKKGTHLPLSAATILLNPKDVYFDDVYARIELHLTRDIRSDFEKLRSTKTVTEADNYTESSTNRLRDFFSDDVQAVVSSEHPSINVQETIRNDGTIIANLRKTTNFSRSQANALGGMLITEILDAVETTQRSRRKRFNLFIDEATRFVGQDLIHGFAETRKFGLCIVLGVQDLSGLRNNEVDMTAKVLSQPGVQISFMQKNPADVETLARLFAYGNLDFTPLVMPVDRPDGQEWVEVEEQSQSNTTGKSWEDGGATSTSDSDQESNSRQFPSETFTQTDTTGHTRGHSTSQSWRDGGSSSETVSVTKKKIPLPKHREEMQHQGRLAKPVDDQVAEWMKKLRTLAKAHALVSVQNNPSCELSVLHVNDPFADNSADWKPAHIAAVQKLIASIHQSYFEPSLSKEAELARIEWFLAQVPVPGSDGESHQDGLLLPPEPAEDSPIGI